MLLRRTTTAAAAALALAPFSMGAAQAHGHAHASHVPGQVRQLVQAAAVTDRALARLAGSHVVTRLADADEQTLVDAIAADRADLATVAAEAAEVQTRADARSVREELRAFRVEVFRQEASLLHQAEELAVEGADDPDVLALVDEATAAAQALTSHSSHADVHAVRDLLEQAASLLGDVTTD